ncbi:EamA/RhaT family transporter, partial [Streptomyces clavuligerus]|uniref:EamA/RhaT family transporter n=1 Tax=Streptomyces clavuligerus TaxID=1901 RepID=UPI0018D08C70
MIPSDRRAALVGPLFVLGYCVINSLKSVLEGSLVQSLSPEFIVVNSFALAQAFYLLTLPDKRGLLADVRRCLSDVVMLNISTAVCWLAFLYAFTVLEPAVVNALINGLVPAITILLGFRLRPGVKALPLEIAAAAGMLAAMGFLLLAAFRGSSAIGEISGGALVFGVVVCVFASTSLSGITYYTKRLGEAGMTVRQILATRFVLLLVSTPVLLVAREGYETYTPRNVLAILAISLVGVIVSIYLLQQGIMRTEPITVSMLFGTNLLITYIAQFLDPRLHQSGETLVGVLVLSAAMCLGTWGRWRAGAAGPAAPATTPPPVSYKHRRA